VVPAGLLVLIALAAISVDSAVAYLGQRELNNAADAAVNDAVTVSLTAEQLQLGPDAKPDAARAVRVVHAALDGATFGSMIIRPEDVEVRVDNAAASVSVMVEGDVDYIFSPAIPGARSSQHIRAQSEARLVVGGIQP